MALTDSAIHNAKPKDKEYELADGERLYLLVTPPGGKLWRLKYRAEGKERKLAIGRYPDVSLGEARKRRAAAREQVAQGIDPARAKQRAKARAELSADDTFEAISKEYSEKRKRDGQGGWAPATATCPGDPE